MGQIFFLQIFAVSFAGISDRLNYVCVSLMDSNVNLRHFP